MCFNWKHKRCYQLSVIHTRTAHGVLVQQMYLNGGALVLAFKLPKTRVQLCMPWGKVRPKLEIVLRGRLKLANLLM